MKSLLTLGLACLCVAGASSAVAQNASTTTVQSDGGTTTTTTTVKKDKGGTTTGAAGGAVAGALVAGPVGAVVGAVAGATVGHTVAPPSEVRTYVTSQTSAPVSYPGDVAVGKTIDGDIAWVSVPSYPKYSWAYVNGQRVVIDNDSHRIAAIY